MLKLFRRRRVERNYNHVIYTSLSRSKWECKYHLIFVPKLRKGGSIWKIREFLKQVFHEFARKKGCEIFGGHMEQDHAHMIISIPPKYAAYEIVGFLKGTSAISIARRYGGRKRNFNGECFWARGYAISTVGYVEQQLRRSNIL